MKLHVDKPYISDVAKIYLISEEGDARFSMRVIENGDIEATRLSYDGGSEIPPFLIMQSKLFDDFVISILEYAQKNKIELDTETALQAKLELTQEHLKDMKGYFDDAWKAIQKKI